MADDIDSLRRILGSCRTVAIVGLSDQWHRPSHFVG
jgi:predicted CoA-binding protein